MKNLLESQILQFRETAHAHGILPANLKFSKDETNGVTRQIIAYSGTRYWFIFSNDATKTELILKPALYKQEEKLSNSESTINFKKVIFQFGNWSKYLKRELDAEKKNKNYLREDFIFPFDDESFYTEEAFTEKEAEEIQQRLNSFNQEIKSLPLSAEQFAVFDKKLDFLISQTKQLRKFDWRSLAIGTIVSIITNMFVDTNVGQLVLKAFGNAFSFSTNPTMLK